MPPALAHRKPAQSVDWVAVGEEIKTRLRCWVTDEDDISDLAQDCLTKVWLKGHTFSGRSAFSSWLYRVIRNEFVSWLRKRDRRNRLERQSARDHPCPRRRDVAEEATDRLAATKLLSRLETIDRRILELHYLDDHTSADIGRRLHLAPSSVRCRVMRLRHERLLASQHIRVTREGGEGVLHL